MDQGKLQIWGVVGEWFSGIATFLAVVLAGVLALFLQRLRRARLVVRYETGHVGDNRYVSKERVPSNDREELWVRLRVENTTRFTAQDVEVRLISMRREGHDSEDRSSRWLKVSHLDKITITVPPEFTQYYDIAFATNKLDSDTDIRFDLAALNPPFLPWDDQKALHEKSGVNRLRIGDKYDISFAVVSGNTEATYYKIGLKAVKQNGAPWPAQGEDYLRHRIEIAKPEPISAREAFSL